MAADCAQPPRVSLVTLGCPMNQVDSERIMSALVARGYEIVPEEEAELIVVNTCGFIETAREESIETILSVAELKQQGNLRALIVAGCMAERYKAELEADLAEADAVIGLADADSIPDVADRLLGRDNAPQAEQPMVLIGYPHSAYLKIAEGCDNRCSYCAIPLIRGGFRSMSQEDIIAEARAFAEYGVRELVLVGQDTTRYGSDTGHDLPELLEKLSAIDDIAWVRLMYAYPSRLDDRLIETMASLPKVVPYLDMPIQHIAPAVLNAMGRPTDGDRIRDVIAELRERIPGMVLRTTLMTGFPGETDAEFQQLLDFLTDSQFERLGVFAYSPEEGTRAMDMALTVPYEVAEERAEVVLTLQHEIAAEFQASLVGGEFDMLVDEHDPGTGGAVGRTYHDAPEIDGAVTVPGGVDAGLPFCRIRITGAEGFDLTGEVVPWRQR